MFGKELWLVGRPVADRLTAASFPEELPAVQNGFWT